jgi:ABC-type multidrug transport system ATPase subunit
LDVEARAQIVTLLKERRGIRGVLLTTHDMHLAYALGERFYLIHKGKLVWSGAREKLESAGILGGGDLEELILSVAGGISTFAERSDRSSLA